MDALKYCRRRGARSWRTLVLLVPLLCTAQPQAARYVADLPQCQTPEFLALLNIDHQRGDMTELLQQHELMAQCTLPSESQRQQARLPNPDRGVINFESPHGHPLDLSADGQTLLAVNTAANSLEVFDTSAGQLRWLDSIPVGHDPVSVRVRNDEQAWVINRISDSISVVDLRLGAVVRTLQSDNEPADVVFAEAQQRAFVSSGEGNRLLVYALDDLARAPQRLSLAMEEPRALAISPDGSTVYAAAFESGNGTTVLSGRAAAAAGTGSSNVLERADTPYSGQNPVPNNGANFSPALTAGDPGSSSLLLRKDGSGRWLDDNSGDWSAFVSGAQAGHSGRVQGWDLPDHDLAHIDTQSLSVSYTSGLMNINAALAVNPQDGRVTVVGTDATNQRRFQPNLNGVFLRVLYADVANTQTPVVADLNPHLDYSVATLPASERERSVGDPRGVVWSPDGARFFVSGLGSNNVVAVSADGSRLAKLAVGEGPTGLVLSSDGARGYVLNRFEASVVQFDTASMEVVQRVEFYDPTPAAVKEGRPHLYNTHSGSGLGHISCASCHVDARTDRLAWDLGEPNGAANAAAHPMKGAMRTQSLVDIIRFPRFHWRGDRSEILDFNATFTLLQGAVSQLNGVEVAELEAFLGSLHFPPNPYRQLDNSLSTDVPLPTAADASAGDAVQGRQLLNACIGCHSNGLSRSNETVAMFGQSFSPPAFHGFYQRLGYDAGSQQASRSGFGVFHDGADPLMTAARSADLLAALMSFDGPENGLSPVQSRQDSHAAVGRQVTLGGLSASHSPLLSQMRELAASEHLELIAKRGGRVGRRGYLYQPSTQRWLSDREGESLEHAVLLGSADASHPITFSLVVAGTGQRLGLDRDLDGQLDNAGDNHAPVFGLTGVRVSVLGVAEDYQLPVTDADGDRLVFSAEQLPEGLVLDAASGRVSGTPTALGDYTVLATVSDGEAGDQIRIEWQVLRELPMSKSVQGGALSFPAGTLLAIFAGLVLRRRRAQSLAFAQF